MYLRTSETHWKALPVGEKLVSQAERRMQSRGDKAMAELCNTEVK